MQEWVSVTNAKVIVIFEGRDAAGKGGAIKRITEPLNPRVCRIAALGTPSEKEKTQWYFQDIFPTFHREEKLFFLIVHGTTVEVLRK